METVVGVEGNDEGKFEESGVEKSNSTLSSPKLAADPVVYKLVRIEGDGRLVPATDDEIMEVGNLLADDKIEMHLVADTGQAGGIICSERTSSGMPRLENSEGLSQSENAEVDAGKSNVNLEENDPSSAPSMNESHINQSGNVGECSNARNEPVEGQSSVSADCTSSKPDFSKLKGEVCLDNLSIKELHETFKATFGRETTVKDKQWLKRRIAMGLTNSCDVSTSSFVIKDNKLVNKDKEENHNNLGSDLAKASAVRTMNDCKDSPINHSGQAETLQIVSSEKLRNSSVDDDLGTEDLSTEQRAAKRVRKPTRRYIEELSEVESKEHSGKLMASTKNSGLRQISIKSNVRPFKMARMDSFGGSGVQVPYVCRVRRSRPRKNVMALMGFHPDGMSVTATLVKKALVVHDTKPNNESGDEVLKVRSAPEPTQQPFTVEPEKDKQFSPVASIEQGQNVEPKHIDQSGDVSDDNVVTVPTGKGGMRRKHHRAWTLSEVMKLVEGVSKYGAGRWSEIKRLAFASYSYRTSVDLKDKWRNLLKASLAQTPPDKRMNSRKHASAMPIPAAILLRVRELAEMQQQVSPNLSSGKLAGSTGRNIYFKRKKTGGISFNSTVQLTHVDEKLCYQILHEYKIHNAEVLFREDATVDDLIDVIEGNRKYMKCVYVYNKIDVIGIDDVDKLARQPNSVVVSCNLKLNLDRLLARMWEEMGLVRVYSKPQGQQPDFTDPFVLSVDRAGCMVEDFCNHIHRNLIKDVKYVLVWGTSARHYPQHCGLGHVLQDEDVVQIVKKKEKEDGGRGRFKSHSTAPARISDIEKKAPLKT